MGFELENAKVLRTTVDSSRPVLARRGAMLGYTGDVRFRPVAGQGSGVRGMAGAMIAGESNRMMAAEGSGTVLYGHRGLYVTVVDVDDAPLTVEADRLLAHDAHLSTSVMMVGSGGIRALAAGAATGRGLFTTQVSGQGQVALLSHGGAFPLTLTGETVGVDPQAYVGHLGHLEVKLSGKVGVRDVVGRGSGESFTLQITGHGTVWVQASEQKF